MVEITKESFSEVYDIMAHLEKRLYEKIPRNFIEIIEKNRDERYIPNIDYSISINDQQISKGARGILAIIYRDYICSEEKKAELLRKDQIELQRIEEENRKKYEVDNLFNKRKQDIIEKTEIEEPKISNNLLMKVEKQNIFTKIIKFIKKIFIKTN